MNLGVEGYENVSVRPVQGMEKLLMARYGLVDKETYKNAFSKNNRRT